jgi:hypothetical protein
VHRVDFFFGKGGKARAGRKAKVGHFPQHLVGVIHNPPMPLDVDMALLAGVFMDRKEGVMTPGEVILAFEDHPTGVPHDFSGEGRRSTFGGDRPLCFRETARRALQEIVAAKQSHAARRSEGLGAGIAGALGGVSSSSPGVRTEIWCIAYLPSVSAICLVASSAG